MPKITYRPSDQEAEVVVAIDTLSKDRDAVEKQALRWNPERQRKSGRPRKT